MGQAERRLASAPESKRADRRAHPRRETNFVATVMLGSTFLPCYIMNMSAAGAHIRLFHRVKLQRGLTRLTCARFGRIGAEVVWQNGVNVGLKFMRAATRSSPS